MSESVLRLTLTLSPASHYISRSRPQLLKLICLTAFHLRNCRQLLNTVTLVLTWCIHLICWLSLAHSQTPTHTLFPPLCLTCDSSQLNGVDLLCLSPRWLIYLHLTAAIAVAHSSDAWDAGSNPANWKMAQLIALQWRLWFWLSMRYLHCCHHSLSCNSPQVRILYGCLVFMCIYSRLHWCGDNSNTRTLACFHLTISYILWIT